MVVAIAVVAAIGLGRLLEPSDLYDNEQPLTISYTADMLINGNWLVYRGTGGELLTKPPLFNWVAAPFVAAAGFGAEWAHKAPSWLGALATFAVVVAMGRRVFAAMVETGGPAAALRRTAGDGDGYPYAFVGDWRALAWVAGLAWAASYPAIKLGYLARPDGVLVACLAAAWWVGTMVVDAQDESLDREGRASRRSLRLPPSALTLLFWLAVGLAALAKGLPALIPVIYVVLLGVSRSLSRGERLSMGRAWRAAKAWGVPWGLPLALAMIGAWLIAAELRQPGLVWGRLIVDEVGGKASSGGWWTPLVGVAMSPGLYVARYLPWSVLSLLGIGHIIWHWRGWRAWVAHPLWPAALWVGVVIVFFVPAADRGDYLAPAMPAGAVLAAYWLGHHLPALRLQPIAAIGAAAVVGLAVIAWRHAIAAPYGEHAHEFAAEVRAIVGDGPIVLDRTGYNPLPTLLGLHPGTLTPDLSAVPADAWFVAPLHDDPRVDPVAFSLPISEVDGKRAAPLALYPPAAPRPTTVTP